MKNKPAGRSGRAAPDLDDPQTTLARRELIRRKPFLRKIYLEWYGLLTASLGPAAGPILEIGSGGGFLAEAIPGLFSSDIMPLPHVDAALDGCRLPFKAGSLAAILMVNVFHHLPRPADFLAEAERCLAPGGRICMIEPWVSAWSRLVYSRLHYEPFDPERLSWETPQGGPLSGGDNALPWIVFQRDRNLFEERFPGLALALPAPMFPVAYVLSGGVSHGASMPGFSYRAVRALEKMLGGLGAMFAHIVLEKRGAAS